MNTSRHTVFGWTIHRVQFADGETQAGIYRENTRLENSESWMPWTKGERDIIEHPAALTDPYILARRGKFIPKVEFAGRVFPKGRYVVQAVGEAENWCFNNALNGNTAPTLNCIWLAAGETYTAPVGTLFLIATGQTSIGTGPLSVTVVSDSITLTAETDAAIITFSRRRDAS